MSQTTSIGGRVMTGTSSAIGSVANATSSVANSIGEKVNSYETSTVLKLLRFINLINSIGLVATGVVNLLTIPFCSGSKCLPTGVISVQLCIFGVLLFAYEARMGNRYDAFVRKQFGFLYGHWGRFFFILFLASLCFGIIYTDLTLWWVQVLVGAFTLANALLNCFVIRHHPGFQSGSASTVEGIGSNSRAASDAPIAAPPSSAYGGGSVYTQGSAYGQGSNSGGAGNPFAVTVV
jgi:hypothetical protein